MSSYENIIGGKLKLKGKALDVAGGVKKKKKKIKKHGDEHCHDVGDEGETSKIADTDPAIAGDGAELAVEIDKEAKDAEKLSEEGKAVAAYDIDDHLTPAERRYIEQRERIDVKMRAKTANKSHRDRIQDFNHYLANMSEHYDIPKVGPG